MHLIHEPPHQKTNNLHLELTSCAVTAPLISALVFAIQIEHPLFLLDMIFQAFDLFSVAVQSCLCRTRLETKISDFLMLRLKYEYEYMTHISVMTVGCENKLDFYIEMYFSLII